MTGRFRRWLAVKLVPQLCYFVNETEGPSSRLLARKTLEFLYVECRFVDEADRATLNRLSGRTA